jgi:4-amino-4-deoxy-L-arabinose transferase-like glycosyltransferase
MVWSRKDWLILFGLTGVAIFFRFFQLSTLPPGFQFDEAFNAIDAQQVLAGSRPLFLAANAGREVLYTYWQALLIRIFGFDVYTLRLASAILGVITIPVTYGLVRGLIRQQSRAVAAGTALVLAISLWHIHFSRYGIRVISMPLIFSGAFGLAWLGAFATTRRTRLLAYLGSGLLTGISVWTHPTGRLAPFVLLGFTLWLLWQYPARRRWGWDTPVGGLVITGITAFLVFVPLGLEFYRHPEFFFGHASEVSVFAARVGGSTPLAALLNNVIHVLGMFSFAGDLGWTHGLAGRPVFDWPLALLFYLGIILGAMRLVGRDAASTPQEDAQSSNPQGDRSALALFAIWAAVMLFPSILSEAAPNYSRTLPALPALFVPAGLGIAWLVNLRQPLPWLGPAAAILILLYSTAQMSYDYFVRFAQSPDVYYMYDGDKLDALDYLSQYTGKNQVYLSQLWGDMHSTVYLLRQGLGIKSIDTADTLVLPPPGQGAVYAFPSEQLERAQQIAALWPGQNVESIPDPYGNVLLHIVHLDAATLAQWPPALLPTTEQRAAFTDAPTLLGMQAANPDKQVTLFWEAEQPVASSLTTFVHLIDRDGQRVAQADKLPGNGSYPTTVWTPGERVIDRAYPDLLDPCAGGETVRVQVGWYELAAGNPPRPRADSAGTTALAGEMTLAYFTYPLETFQPAVNLVAPFSPTLSLQGYTLDEQELQAGSPLTLDLLWQSTNANDKAASGQAQIRLNLLGKNARYELWQGQIAPGSRWDDGLALCRRIHATLPQELAAGDYTLMIDQPSVTTTQPVTLGTVAIGPSTRRYELPELARTIGITLTDSENNQIVLVGLSSEPRPDLATNQLTVDLVWQPVARVNGNYKAFVHLLDSTGTIIAQSDANPGGDTLTSRWLPGEVILDRHILTLPPGVAASDNLEGYQLVAGLYDPIGMQRLSARTVGGIDLPDGRVPLGSLSLPAP